MTMVDDGGEFARQAAIAHDMGSDFVARVLEAGLRQLHHAPRTARMIADWAGDRAAAAVALRFNGAIHALARRGATSGLVALYDRLDGDFDAVLADLLAREDDFLAEWMKGVPQTNEVGRAAAIVAALLVVADRFGLPFELLELGSSAGLNLNLARYFYHLGSIETGDPFAPLLIAPEWRGPMPPDASMIVNSARGVDIDPLDLNDAAMRERLLAYVWADRPERTARLEAAIAIALIHRPRIDRQDAAEWIAERLAEPQAEGICRVIFHSIVLQYLSVEGRGAVETAVREAGARATEQRSLAWISYEWDAARSNVCLSLTCFPGGTTQELARCQAHAAWIEWHGSVRPD